MSSLSSFGFNAFRKDSDCPKQKISILFNQGGLGDCIAKVPALRFFLRQNPKTKVTLFLPDYFYPLWPFFELSEEEEKKLIVREMQDLGLLDYRNSTIDFKHPTHTSLSTNLTQHAFNLLCNREIPEEDKPELFSYPTLRPYPSEVRKDKPYVCLAIEHTSETRAFPLSELPKINEYFKAKGINLVLLGSGKNLQHNGGKGKFIKVTSPEVLEDENIKDFRGKLTLPQVPAILKESEALLAQDSGLVHLAACLPELPLVVGHTSVSPEHRVIYREGKREHKIKRITPEVSCRFCQSNMGYIPGHHFRFCFYDDYRCVSEITAEKFITAYEKVRNIN